LTVATGGNQLAVDDAGLRGEPEGSEEEAELEKIIDLIEVYEIKRWPLGQAAGRKGVG
jgi:hypothetical protein